MSEIALLLTTSAAAKLVDRTPDTVRRWERDGLLRAIRTTSGMRLFERADVIATKRAIDEGRRHE